MRSTFPVVRELVEPKHGRPASEIGPRSSSQRELVAASLLRLPEWRTARPHRPGTGP